jgi:hypothetical protein
MSAASELPNGAAVLRVKAARSRLFGSLVWKSSAGPATPRASMLITAPISFASGSLRAKDAAPRRPGSSPSVIRKITGSTGRRFFRIAAISSAAATPAPSSPAPGPAATES